MNTQTQTPLKDALLAARIPDKESLLEYRSRIAQEALDLVGTLERRNAELVAALEAITNGANPRPAVVGGKTHDYIVTRALIDAARALLARVQS